MKLFSKALNAVWDAIHPEPPTTTLSTPTTQAQARVAIEDAQDALDAAKSNTTFIFEKVVALREQRDRNHFAEMIELTMRGNG
jgi:hypothetical protein